MVVLFYVCEVCVGSPLLPPCLKLDWEPTPLVKNKMEKLIKNLRTWRSEKKQQLYVSIEIDGRLEDVFISKKLGIEGKLNGKCVITEKSWDADPGGAFPQGKRWEMVAFTSREDELEDMQFVITKARTMQAIKEMELTLDEIQQLVF